MKISTKSKLFALLELMTEKQAETLLAYITQHYGLYSKNSDTDESHEKMDANTFEEEPSSDTGETDETKEESKNNAWDFSKLEEIINFSECKEFFNVLEDLKKELYNKI